MKRTTWMLLAGAAAGAVGGWAWYAKVGCTAGTCAITAHPWSSMAYGALLGATAISFFTSGTPRPAPQEQEQHNTDQRS